MHNVKNTVERGVNFVSESASDSRSIPSLPNTL